MDHQQPYPPGYIADILSGVRTIAVVGASPRPSRPSNGVTLFLHQAGFDVIPVNPRDFPGEIHGLKVYPSLAAIDRPVDMVDVFRESRALKGIAEEAIAIGARVLWAQVGIFDAEAARIAEAAGLKVVMNRCTRTEVVRLGMLPLRAAGG